MLKLNSVYKKFNQQKVLGNISIEIKTGEFLSIIGKSGVGKTTMLNILAGLIRPDEGSVNFKGEDLTSMSEEQLAEFRLHNVGIVFQDFKIFPSLSVSENIMLALYPRQDIAKSEQNRRIKEVLEQVELSHKVKEKAAILSGGEKQRVAIARSLVGRPTIVFADEPTGNLDTTTSDTIMTLFSKLHKDLSTSFMIITHDNDIAKQAEKIYELKASGLSPVSL